jgi:hypothetical protein
MWLKKGRPVMNFKKGDSVNIYFRDGFASMFNLKIVATPTAAHDYWTVTRNDAPRLQYIVPNGFRFMILVDSETGAAIPSED